MKEKNKTTTSLRERTVGKKKYTAFPGDDGELWGVLDPDGFVEYEPDFDKHTARMIAGLSNKGLGLDGWCETPSDWDWDDERRAPDLMRDRLAGLGWEDPLTSPQAKAAAEAEVLSSYTQKLGDRRVRATLWSNGEYSIHWTLKTGYRTKKDTRVRLSPEAARATILCAVKCSQHADKLIGWDPKDEEQSETDYG